MAISLSLATVDEVADRVGEEITDPTDVAMVRSLLRLVSAQVRHHGAPWADPILAPDVVRAVTIEAAARGYLNPEGFSLERGDEITFQREDSFAVGATLTRDEIKMIRAAAGKHGMYAVRIQRDVMVDPTHTGVLYTSST